MDYKYNALCSGYYVFFYTFIIQFQTNIYTNRIRNVYIKGVGLTGEEEEDDKLICGIGTSLIGI